jgi:hypothetical protein
MTRLPLIVKASSLRSVALTSGLACSASMTATRSGIRASRRIA